jgi:hypothetical protein
MGSEASAVEVSLEFAVLSVSIVMDKLVHIRFKAPNICLACLCCPLFDFMLCLSQSHIGLPSGYQGTS